MSFFFVGGGGGGEDPFFYYLTLREHELLVLNILLIYLAKWELIQCYNY